MAQKNSEMVTQKRVVIDLKEFKDGSCKIAEFSGDKLALCKSGTEIHIYPVDEEM